MTCIVGVVDRLRGGGVIGGDSAASSGSSLALRADTKVFRTQNYVMGFTSSYRMGQLLRYSTLPEAPSAEVDWDLDRFMATRFVDGVRSALRAGGWLGKDSMSRDDGGSFLVGVRGSLYAVYDDFQIARTTNDFAAVGAGQDLALGSLHTTEMTAARGETAHSAEARAVLALRAAAEHSSYVSEPFIYEEIPQ